MQRKFTVKLIIVIASVLVLILLFRVFNVYNLLQKQFYKQEYSEYVNKYAEMNDIDPMWIYAIIKVESNFDKNATSGSGAKGLMQLMDSTAIEISKHINLENFESDMLYDPEINIMLGTRYFVELLDRYDGNYYLAIAAYNGGIGNVDNWISKGIIDIDGSNIENIPYKETNMYVRKSVKAYNMYRELYNI